VVDEEGGLGCVGEVGGDEKDVVGGLDGLAGEKRVAGEDELVLIAGGEDEFGSRATVTVRQRKAEAAGAAGDEDDLAWATFCRARHESVDGCGGDDAGGDLRGLECDSGLLHASLRCRDSVGTTFIQV
jgi:hypothetical protein